MVVILICYEFPYRDPYTDDISANMNIRKISLIFLLTMVFSSTCIAKTSDAKIVAITSATFNPGPVSRNILRAIFVMRLSKWNDGTPVKVYVFDDASSAHEAFCKEILQFFPKQLRQALDKQVFSGLGQYPEQVDSVTEMLTKVKSTPGSIGYIYNDEVSEDVRILQITP